MIIVLSGEKQHGKDTFAKVIQDVYPSLKFQRRAFADKMKEMAVTLLDCEYSELEELKTQNKVKITNPKAIKRGTNMRRYLQTLGELVKIVTDNKLIWCDVLGDNMGGGENYIVTDCRFPFEAEFLRDFAKYHNTPITVVKVVNPRVESGKDMHESEQSFSDIKFDGTITNDGAVKDLENPARFLVANLEMQRSKP